MTALELLMRPYIQTGKWTMSNVIIVTVAASNNSIVAAPGATHRILVCDGAVSGVANGFATWYHTANAAQNRLTGPINHTNNGAYRIGPWLLPPNQPLIVNPSTVINGWATIAIVEDEE